MRYLGVDLAWGPVNETGLVVLDGTGTVHAAGWARGVPAVLDWIGAHVAGDDALAFVDAPLVVRNPAGQRLCEKQVGQRYGAWKVAANSTNLASRNLAGVTLLAALTERGWCYDDGHDGPPAGGRRVSECYPYTALVGVPELGYDVARPLYKRAPRGMRAAAWRPLRAAGCDDLVGRLVGLATDPPLRLESHPETLALLAERAPLDSVRYKHREDLLDAAVCAWTAALWHRHGTARCQVLGEPRGGAGPVATIVAPARSEQCRI